MRSIVCVEEHMGRLGVSYMGAVFRVVSGQSFPYLVLVCMLISQLEWIPVAFSLSFSPSPSLRAFSEHVLGWKIHKNAPIRSQCSHCDTVLKHQQETSYSGSAWGSQLQLFGLSIPYLSTIRRDAICMTTAAQIENIN